MDPFEILLSTAPGQEPALAAEAAEAGFAVTGTIPGGVTFTGGWIDVWRANLTLRIPTHVLARIGSFRAMHLAQLDKRARKFEWGTVLRRDVPLKVEATTRASRIYHAGAARQRIETALVEEFGATLAPDAPVIVKLRIEDDLCTLSVDTSGDSMHKRGFKEYVGKAPLRETLAAGFLRDCGFQPDQPLYDPMCGSGTFVLEAAEIAAGLWSGRARSFAFQQMATFDPVAYGALMAPPPHAPSLRFFGSDRDDGAVRGANANAARASVSTWCRFTRATISDVAPPDGPPGLVMVNPPYGTRIGERKLLFALYGSLGTTLKTRFRGWRVGLVTSDAGLAKATGLPFLPPGAPVSHGGLSITLWRTDPL
jgi:putative N6-adenine-specific DNA methylase